MAQRAPKPPPPPRREDATKLLAAKGGLHEDERKRAHTGSGY